MNLKNEQVVWGCFNVTVGDLKKSIENGAKSFVEVQEDTSVAKGCKRCTDSVKELVENMLK